MNVSSYLISENKIKKIVKNPHFLTKNTKISIPLVKIVQKKTYLLSIAVKYFKALRYKKTRFIANIS